MNIRRVPGFMYHYKLISVIVFLLFLSIVYLLIHWGIMCTNLEAWKHVSNVVSIVVTWYVHDFIGSYTPMRRCAACSALTALTAFTVT